MPSISQANILLLTDSELSAILHLLHSVKSSPMMELETNDPMEGPSSSLLLSFEQTMVDIEKPHHHDVLCGRGVTTNRHPGNESFRSLVSLNKELYVSSTKRQKMSISRSIVEAVRSLNPAGRFLERDPSTGLWSDIGHKKAVEKTSQALRDGASDLRKQLSTDLRDPDFLNAVFDMDFDRGDQKLENQDSEKGEGSDREKGFDEDDSNMEEDSNDKDKETIRVSDRAKYAKMKPPPVKKGHRRVKSNPCAVTSLNLKLIRQQGPSVEPPPSPGAQPERIISLATRRSPNPHSPRQHPASQPSSPSMPWGGRPSHFSEPQSPSFLGSIPHRSPYYDHHSSHLHYPPYRPHGPPSPSHMTFSRSRSHSIDGPHHVPPPRSPLTVGPGPPLDHRYPPTGPPYRPHHRPQGYHHHGYYPPPTHSPHQPQRPPSPPLPQGSLPPGRYQFSPSGYRSRPPPPEWSPRVMHHHHSPRHHHSPHAEYHSPHAEYHAEYRAGHSPSWSRSPSPRGQYISQGNPSNASEDNDIALSVPNLCGEGVSSKITLSPRMPLISRSFRHLGGTPPRHPSSVPIDFTPPPSSPISPRFVTSMTRAHRGSSNSPASKDRESGKSDEKKEDIAPYPSLTESRASPISSSSTPLLTLRDLGIRQKTKIEDENRTLPGMFSRADNSDGEKDAALLPYDEAEENPADEMDDISMWPSPSPSPSPIPFDRGRREDPTTLMELPENLLSLPISPCGPHDDPTSQ